MDNKLVAVKMQDKDGRVVTRHVRQDNVAGSKKKSIPVVAIDSPSKQNVIGMLQKATAGNFSHSGYSTFKRNRILKRAAQLPENTLKYVSELMDSAPWQHTKLWNASTLAALLDSDSSARQIEDRMFILQPAMSLLGETYSDVEYDDNDGSAIPREETFGQYSHGSLVEILRGISSYQLDELPYDFDGDEGQTLREMDDKLQSDFCMIADVTLRLVDGGSNSRSARELVDGNWMVRMKDTEDVRMLLRHSEHIEKLAEACDGYTQGGLKKLLASDHGGHVGAMLDIIKASKRGKWLEDWAEKDRLCDGGDMNEETGEITYSVDLYGPRLTQLVAAYPNKVELVAEFIDNWNNRIIPASDDPELVRFISEDVPSLRAGRL